MQKMNIYSNEDLNKETNERKEKRLLDLYADFRAGKIQAKDIPLGDLLKISRLLDEEYSATQREKFEMLDNLKEQSDENYKDLIIEFPLLIFEPSKDYSETFMWRLYSKCRMKERKCELLARTIFDALREPPLNLLYRKDGYNGWFGFYDCESAIEVCCMSIDENNRGHLLL
ncbi:MAG: hypothetical protein U0L76_01090 [Ruminococcus sp.]|nr:hypothetical protein [Ruminococcus sp.]